MSANDHPVELYANGERGLEATPAATSVKTTTIEEGAEGEKDLVEKNGCMVNGKTGNGILENGTGEGEVDEVEGREDGTKAWENGVGGREDGASQNGTKGKERTSVSDRVARWRKRVKAVRPRDR